MRRGRRVTYRPSKGQALVGGVVGVIFVLLGLFVVIPMAGVFGLLWTLIAGIIAGMNLYQAFGKGYLGPEIRIQDEGGEEDRDGAGAALSPQDRLERLRTLRDQNLVTQEEYEEKRTEILKEL